jgi:transcriptional regulator with PAS, ATPase and Fis domain
VVDEAEESTERQDTGPALSIDRLRVNVFWDGGALARVLPTSGSLTIGRGVDCDLRIEHASVSRKHARLHVDPLRLEDLASANGTRVAGRTVARGSSVVLATEQVVEIGAAVLVVHGPESSPVSPGEDRMQALLELVERVAKGNISVLIVGETGAGKEVVAERIHRSSPRAPKPLVRVNCAALGETLLESELFGHERGAFTGAQTAKPGLIEAADGGTFFLDEVGELPATTQAKLLRVLETRQLRRLGSVKSTAIDVRFVSATNRDLQKLCAARAFREDLYYRLNGVTVRVPPLRERGAEIRTLAQEFLTAAAASAGRGALTLSAAAIDALVRYSWPGNVRQLKNVIERAALVSGASVLEPADLELDLPLPSSTDASPSGSPIQTSEPSQGGAPASEASLKQELENIERRRILDALARCGGNQTQAAKALGIPRRTLLARLDVYGVPRPRRG